MQNFFDLIYITPINLIKKLTRNMQNFFDLIYIIPINLIDQ